MTTERLVGYFILLFVLVVGILINSYWDLIWGAVGKVLRPVKPTVPPAAPAISTMPTVNEKLHELEKLNIQLSFRVSNLSSTVEQLRRSEESTLRAYDRACADRDRAISRMTAAEAAIKYADLVHVVERSEGDKQPYTLVAVFSRGEECLTFARGEQTLNPAHWSGNVRTSTRMVFETSSAAVMSLYGRTGA